MPVIAAQRLSGRLILLVSLLLGSQVGFSQNAPISVANGDVSGFVTGIQTLNSSGGGTIVLAPSGLYTLTQPADWWYGPNGLPAIRSSIVIEGNGSTIQRSGTAPRFRFFYVSGGFSTLSAGSLTLHDLTLTGGLAEGGNGGSGVWGGGGSAGMGGAIFNQGTTKLVGVTLTSNIARGGRGGGGASGRSGWRRWSWR